MVKLTIITINYNNLEGLKKTLSSVINQSFKNFEFIVIDGSSTDGSVQYLDANKSEISKMISEPDSGIYNAQNKGIKLSEGDYLLFLNSGDYLHDNNVIEKIIPFLVNYDIVYGDMIIEWAKGHQTIGRSPDVITKLHMYNGTLWHPVSFIKRDLFYKYGMYDESLKLVADYDFFFKAIVAKNVSTYHVPEIICVYNTEGASSNQSNKELEKRERRIVAQRYLSTDEIELFKKTAVNKPIGLIQKIKAILSKFK